MDQAVSKLVSFSRELDQPVSKLVFFSWNGSTIFQIGFFLLILINQFPNWFLFLFKWSDHLLKLAPWIRTLLLFLTFTHVRELAFCVSINVILLVRGMILDQFWNVFSFHQQILLAQVTNRNRTYMLKNSFCSCNADSRHVCGHCDNNFGTRKSKLGKN